MQRVPAHRLTVHGWLSGDGLPEHGPLRVGIPIADLCGGIFAAYGVTVALLEREQSGKGQWLHTSLLEAMIYMMDFQTSRWTIDGEIPGQAGNFHPTSIPTGVYKTSDGHINIAVFGGRDLAALRRGDGCPRVDYDERSRTKTNRSVHREWLNAEIEKRLMHNTMRLLVATLNEAGVACGRINNLKEVLRGAAGAAPRTLKKGHFEASRRADSDGSARDAHANPFPIARAAPSGESLGRNPLRNWLRPRRPLTQKAAGVY